MAGQTAICRMDTATRVMPHSNVVSARLIGRCVQVNIYGGGEGKITRSDGGW
ncbi:MAG TPA: hypothetical protein VF452_16025 [Candidatus Binatia bacterium]